jgi:hypothetical protein
MFAGQFACAYSSRDSREIKWPAIANTKHLQLPRHWRSGTPCSGRNQPELPASTCEEIYALIAKDFCCDRVLRHQRPQTGDATPNELIQGAENRASFPCYCVVPTAGRQRCDE